MIYRRTLVSELQNTAGGAFTVLFSIVVTIGLVQVLNQTAGGRYDTSSILEVVAYTSLTNLPALIALALFIAVFMSLNRYWRDSEMFVWFSAGGLSLASWIRPVVRFSVPIIFLVAICSIVISPWSRAELASYRDRFNKRDEVTKLSSGQFIEAKRGQQIFFLEDVDQSSGTVGKVFLAEPKPDGSQRVVVSENGRIELKPNGDRYIVLNDGRRYSTNSKDMETQVTDFKTYEVRLDTSPTVQSSNYQINSMPITRLWLLKDKNNQAKAELFWRLSWPLVAFILAILAIPLSYNNPRAMKYYGQTAAVLIFILYLNCLSVFQTWIVKGTLTMLSAAVLMNAPFVLLTVFLFYRLMTMNTRHFDSDVFNWLARPFRALKNKKG